MVKEDCRKKYLDKKTPEHAAENSGVSQLLLQFVLRQKGVAVGIDDQPLKFTDKF
ncbi:MAG: hypothetical protein HGB36_03075 [Chlorobiaceae bacterium]|jgi:hypothetical protein|nr:hypothetical protein [Chlorobiaceae bacterium]